jgi:proteic killer suppression protein
MIRSFANAATRRLYETGKSKFAGLDVEDAKLLLSVLDEAVSLAEISPLKSMGLHKPKGSRKGFWAMTIGGLWRLVFRFADGDAYDVEIVDYH